MMMMMSTVWQRVPYNLFCLHVLRKTHKLSQYGVSKEHKNSKTLTVIAVFNSIRQQAQYIFTQPVSIRDQVRADINIKGMDYDQPVYIYINMYLGITA
jgi:hypothetical protein